MKKRLIACFLPEVWLKTIYNFQWQQRLMQEIFVYYKVSDLSWLKTVQLPLHIHNSVKGTFKFHPSKKVDVIGSFGLETFVRRHENIDVAVEIPKVVRLSPQIMWYSDFLYSFVF